MTTALLIQGAWHSRWTERFEEYSSIFDQIVVSIYKNDLSKLALFPNVLAHPKLSVVLNHSSIPPGADWYGNVWYQCLTTRAGLQQVRCDYVIKARTDEYWSNLSVMKTAVETSGRMACINIYFKKPCWFPFHIGDHLYGGSTDVFRRGFDILEQNLAKDSFNNSSMAAEQKICLSLLSAAGEVPNWINSSTQMRANWTTINAALLEPFWFNAPSVGTVGRTLAHIAECETHNPTVDLFDSIDKYFE